MADEIKDEIRYDRLVEDSLRNVVRSVLEITAEQGLLGEHHFYITFRTATPGVVMPDYLREQHGEELTIVLQHQFSGLKVDADGFHVSLSFGGVREHLAVPFAALSAFVDPSVNFGLQFKISADNEEDGDFEDDAAAAEDGDAAADGDADAPEKTPEKLGAEVVALDSFRKK